MTATGATHNEKTGAPRRRSAEIRDVVTILARAFKRTLAFRHAREQHGSFLAPVMNALGAVLEETPTLTLDVGPENIFFEEQAVYKDAARQSSLCFRMYRDGVRSITFHRGLEVAELLSFFECLLPEAEEETGRREDVVTELWKADLIHVRHTAELGYLMESDASAADDGPASTGAIRERAQSALERHASHLSREDERAALAQPALLNAEQLRAFDPCQPGRLRLRAASTILRIAASGMAGKDQSALAETYSALIDEALAPGRADELSYLLEECRHPQLEPSPEFVAGIRMRMLQAPRLQRALTAAASSPGGDGEWLPSFLDLLPDEAGAALLAALPGQTSPRIQGALAKAAAARLAHCPDLYRRSLTCEDAPAARALLAALRGVASPLAASVAVGGLEHRARPVNLLALSAVAVHPATALSHLMPLLSHPDIVLRMAAAETLASCGAEAAPLLINAMSRPAFDRAEPAERAAFYQSLGILATAEGFAFLSARLAEAAAGASRARDIPAERRFLIQAILAEKSDRSLAALEGAERAADSNEVAATCRMAMRNLRSVLARKSVA